jgi:pimeloyl-ACP methyl ester carboxylesterase
MQVELLAKLLSGIMEGYHTPGLRASMVIPVGHSFGSLLVQQLVAKYPQLMSSKFFFIAVLSFYPLSFFSIP